MGSRAAHHGYMPPPVSPKSSDESLYRSDLSLKFPSPGRTSGKLRAIINFFHHSTSLRFLLAGCLLSLSIHIFLDRFRPSDESLRPAIYGPWTRHWKSPTCGSTPEEARKKQCVFDLMHYAWVPEKCYFPALANYEYLTFANTSFYSSPSPSPATAIPIEEVMKGEIEVVYHTKHYRHYQCAYGWKMLRKAVMTRTLVDSRTANKEENARCGEIIYEHLLKSRIPSDEVYMKFEMEYLTCERLRSTRLVAQDYL